MRKTATVDALYFSLLEQLADSKLAEADALEQEPMDEGAFECACNTTWNLADEIKKLRESGEHLPEKRIYTAMPSPRGKIDPAIVRESVRSEIETIKRNDTSRFAAWMEFVPFENRSIALTSMTKAQVVNAAKEHHDRGVFSIGRAKWLAKIANRMDGNFQIVSDVWKESELVDLARDVASEVGLVGSDIVPAINESGG